MLTSMDFHDRRIFANEQALAEDLTSVEPTDSRQELIDQSFSGAVPSAVRSGKYRYPK